MSSSCMVTSCLPPWRRRADMEIRRRNDHIEISELDPFLAELLRQIPSKHSDAWLRALNQARLIIVAKDNFTENELNDHFRSPIGSRRDLSLFQVNFYGFLQEFILRELER